MAPALGVGGYRELLSDLLERCDTTCGEEEQRELRAVVRERRNWRPGREPTPVSETVAWQADEIVKLLESAAQVLRPRETQQLDDLVAGKKPSSQQIGVSYAPVRLRRRGAGSA